MSYKLLFAATVAASTLASSAVADYTTVPLQRQKLVLPEGVDLNRDVHLQQHVAKGHADHKAHVMSTAHLRSDSRFHTSAVESASLIGCISNDVWGHFTIGTPAQEFLLLVDSGSTTLGVAGTPLQATTTTQTVTPEYNPLKSSTASVAPYIGRVSPSVYGDGSNFAGQIISDVVNIAGYTNGPAIKFIDIVESVNFFRPVDCTTGQNADSEHTFQGIIGFAFPSLADLDIIGTAEGSVGLPTIGAETTDQWFSKYLAANPGTDPVFAHEICDLSGTLYVGGAPTVDATTYTTSVPSQTYWTVSATAVGVEGSNDNATAADLGETLVDSGTSVWVLNGAAYTKVSNAITSNSEFASKFGSAFFSNGNCVNNPYSSIAEANAALPKITASFADAVNGGEFTVELDPVTSYLYPQYAGPDGGPYTYQLCPGIANGGTLTSGMSIYGVTFLSQFLTTYTQNGASSTVSFAKTGCPKLVA